MEIHRLLHKNLTKPSVFGHFPRKPVLFTPDSGDIDDCLAGCDQARKNAAIKKVGKIVEETWYVHAVLGVGTVVCMLTKNVVGTVVVGIADVVDITIIVNAGTQAKKKADDAWRKCCTDCGTTWGDPGKAKSHIDGKD